MRGRRGRPDRAPDGLLPAIGFGEHSHYRRLSMNRAEGARVQRQARPENGSGLGPAAVSLARVGHPGERLGQIQDLPGADHL